MNAQSCMMSALRDWFLAQLLSPIAVLSVLATAPACLVDVNHSGHQYACSEQGLCPTGLECVSGMCVAPGQVADAAVVFDGAIVVPDAVPPDADPHLYFQVSFDDEDAEELISTGVVNLFSSDLELATDADVQIVGMRFSSITIDPGETIASAYIQFEVDEPSAGPTALTIQAESSSNPAVFEELMGNLSARPTSDLAIDWAPLACPTEDAAGSDQATPELRELLQERIDDANWSSGNAIVFLIRGTGLRTAEAFDGEPAAAAELIILLE